MGKESDYDELIEPQLREIAKTCEDLGMSMIARVMWQRDHAGITAAGMTNVDAAQRMTQIAALSQGNIDNFLIEVIKRFDVSQSLYLRQYMLDAKKTPYKRSSADRDKIRAAIIGELRSAMKRDGLNFAARLHAVSEAIMDAADKAVE